MGYGYDRRPDPDERFIKGNPVSQPRNKWPRRVADAVKNPAEATGSLLALQQVCQADGAAFIGLTPVSQTEGGPGSTTITNNNYWTDLGRWCRYVEITSTGTDDKRINRTSLALNISPLAVLDPTKPLAPWIHWFEDICAARLDAPSAGEKGAFHFGLTWENAIGVPLAAPKPFIGIYANWSATAYGTWTARCVNDSGSGLDQSLGITTELPHRLAFGIDGNGIVHFCIDGEELYTYTTTGSDLGTHTIFAVTLRWTVAADNGATIKAGYYMDLQSLASVQALEETGD